MMPSKEHGEACHVTRVHYEVAKKAYEAALKYYNRFCPTCGGTVGLEAPDERDIQCEACCINGVPCHEIGCPNQRVHERPSRL